MEPWQRVGTYAAGLALDAAKLKGNAELLARTDMIVAAGGGERDMAVDGPILTGIETAADPEAFLNERLMSDLRPTLFLAQLSNLLAGNISIVHGVTGSSRTFMGEEVSRRRRRAGGAFAHRGRRQRHRAGRRFAALRAQGHAAALRVRARQSARRLCAGLAARAAGRLRARIARRLPGDRGAQPRRSARRKAPRQAYEPFCPSASRSCPVRARRCWSGCGRAIAPKLHSGQAAIISGATGVETATTEERAFLSAHADVPVRATGSRIGHGVEPAFPMNVAIAALALHHGKLFPPGDDTGVEQAMDGALAQVVVTSVGIVRGEGMALLEAVEWRRPRCRRCATRKAVRSWWQPVLASSPRWASARRTIGQSSPPANPAFARSPGSRPRS